MHTDRHEYALLAPGEGELLEAGGNVLVIKVASSRQFVCEYSAPANFRGPPCTAPGLRRDVRRGRGPARDDDPRGADGAATGRDRLCDRQRPNKFRNPAGQRTRFLLVCSPGGMDDYFRGIATGNAALVTAASGSATAPSTSAPPPERARQHQPRQKEDTEMQRLNSISHTAASRAATLAGAALIADGVLQLLHSQKHAGSRVVGLAGNLNLMFVAIALAAMAPCLVVLGASAAQAAETAGAGRRREPLLAVGCLTSIVNQHDLAVFPAIAGLANLAWFGGVGHRRVAGSRRSHTAADRARPAGDVDLRDPARHDRWLRTRRRVLPDRRIPARDASARRARGPPARRRGRALRAVVTHSPWRARTDRSSPTISFTSPRSR